MKILFMLKVLIQKVSLNDKKGKFYNSLTIITQPEVGFFNNIKLFRNGSISGTGIKKIENGEISVELF